MADSNDDKLKVAKAEGEYENAKEKSRQTKKKVAIAVAAVAATVATGGAAGGAFAGAGGGAAAGGAAAGAAAAGGGAAAAGAGGAAAAGAGSTAVAEAGGAAAASTGGTATGVAAGTEAGTTVGGAVTEGTATGAGTGNAAGNATKAASDASSKSSKAADKFRKYEEKAKDAKKKYDDFKENYDKIKDKVDQFSGDSDDEEEDEDNEEEDAASAEQERVGQAKQYLAKKEAKEEKKKHKKPIKSAIKGLVIGIILFLIPIILLFTPILLPTLIAVHVVDKIITAVTTLINKAVSVVREFLGLGEVPDETAEKFNNAGIEIGSVTATGEFIKTNRVIASGPEYLVAAGDGTQVRVESGELFMRYKGKIISADELESELETNADFYEAFNGVVESQIKEYNETSANSAKSIAYEQLGIPMDPYANIDYSLEGTDAQNAFNVVFADIVDGNDISIITGSISSGEETETEEEGEESGGPVTAGSDGSSGGGQSQSQSSRVSAADYGGSKEAAKAEARRRAREYAEEIAENTTADGRGDAAVTQATRDAAALINAATSANDPVYAARAYAGMMEAIDMSKPGREHGEPSAEALNMMTEEVTTTAIDPVSCQEVETTASVITSPNFQAVLYDDDWNLDAALKYGRDSFLVQAINEVIDQTLGEDNALGGVLKAINNTVASIVSFIEDVVNWFVSLFRGKTKADADMLLNCNGKDVGTDILADSLFTKQSEVLEGEALGEKGVEGAAYLNNVMARSVGSATASDEAAIAAYSNSVVRTIARKAEAERATKSPFDVSSPYTFLGTIVSKIQPIFNSGSVMGKITAVNNLTSKSIATIVTGAYADGVVETYQTQTQENGRCATAKSVDIIVQGDMYCNESPTFDETTFSMTLEDFQNNSKFSNTFDSNGKIRLDSNLAKYVLLQSDREASPGLQDANVCVRNSMLNLFRDRFSSIEEFENFVNTAIANNVLDDVASSCDGQDLGIATGREYANTGNNGKWNNEYRYYQGYMLETYMLDLFGYYEQHGTVNPVVALREDYYDIFPKDNSPEGILARRTGWTKKDIIAGIRAIEYLAYLKNYDPSTRYAFIETTIPGISIKIESNEMSAIQIALDEKRKSVYFDHRKKNNKIALA